MSKFELAAMGGTFDILHKGHRILLSKAFSVSSELIIGLTSDDLAKRKGKNIMNLYEKRFKNLENLIQTNFPDTSYYISKLEDDFGPAVLEEEVQALIVSEETASQGDVLNNLRHQKGLPAVKVVIVPMVMAKDGNRISTTRIKNSEIDSEGKLSSVD